jgi:hypothetical protein
MNNPSIIVVSRVTGALVSRTNFADFASANGDVITLTELSAIADELRLRGCVTVAEHELIDVTPSETDVRAFMRAKADELSAKCGYVHATVAIEVTNYGQYGGKVPTVADQLKNSTYVDGDTYRHGPTLADAMQASILAMDPYHRASQLKRRAEAMLAEANALSPQLVAA